jgi:hypothetical protein
VAAGPSDTAAAAHNHSGAGVSIPMGDGTAEQQYGYTLRKVRLPRRAGEPGRVSFVVENYRGRPQTRYLVEQTKRIHVYVVRSDFAVYRHVHPQMRPDGTWVGHLTLPQPGDYRVVAEFIARDEGGGGDHVLLGDEVRVPGAWRPRAVAAATEPGSDWAVRATALGDLVAAKKQDLRIRLTRPDGSTPTLGTYLGSSAHLTGFHVGTGSAVHMHPRGASQVTTDGVELVFEAELPLRGRYLLFLQVRVDDFLHTVRLPVSVT